MLLDGQVHQEVHEPKLKGPISKKASWGTIGDLMQIGMAVLFLTAR